MCTEGRCPGCTVRAIGTGFYPKATGKSLLRMKTLWLSLRGDRTGMRAVLGDRVLLHQWVGLLKVQDFRAAWQRGMASKFLEQLRWEGSPDLALAGEELLQAEPRGLSTWVTGTKGKSYWGTQASFWVSMGAVEQPGTSRGSGWEGPTARDPHQLWLTRLEEWEWWLATSARMAKRTTVPHPTLISWNIGPLHWLFSREWIRKAMETSAPIIMLQEVRLPPGSHRTVKWCFSQICPDYDIWMEEGREPKGPPKDRRDHGFDCGLGLAVITMLHRRVFNAAKTAKIEWMQGSQQRTLGHLARGRVLMLGMTTHSGETYRCVNLHQAGYSDTIRRELVWENLSKAILDSRLTRTIIGGDMNAASPGNRYGYSQNPITAHMRQSADEALLEFSKKIGGALISPLGPTWRRGDSTQSATLDHVILVNFPATEAKAVAVPLGDIQHDHLCLQIGLDSMIFGEWAPQSPPTASAGPRLESKTWSRIKNKVDTMTESFNREVEKQTREGRMNADTAVERMMRNKLKTALSVLKEDRQRTATKEAKRGPHRDKEQRERLREITTLQIALTTLGRPGREGNEDRGEQGQGRDRTRRKMQSWAVTRSLSMIAPEVMSPGVSDILPSSNLDVLTRLIQKWKDWKMSEVDDIVQTQTRRNNAQEWSRQRRTFLEEKHGLSLLTGKRKPNAPQVELREEVPVGILHLSEMGVAGSAITAESPQDGPQRRNGVDLSTRSWAEAHMLRLAIPKGKTDSSSKIILKAMGLWKQTFRFGQAPETEERQVGRGVRNEKGNAITRSGSAEDEVWRDLRYEGGVGEHGSEGLRMEGERRWLASSVLGRDRLVEWAALLLKTAEGENEELGVLSWGIQGLQEPAKTSTVLAQLVTVSELNDVGDILGAGMSRTGLMERQIVWGEGPWREANMLRAWEMVLEGKAYAKSPRCGNSTECKGQPVPISKVVDGVGTINSFCQNCWDWSDFHKHRPTPLPMDFLTKWGVFNTRLARPEKGGLRGTLTEEELEKVLSTYVKGRLSPGPDGVITELLKDATCTERKVILLWINDVLTAEKPGLRLSAKEVHGLVALLHKGGGSTDRASDYRPVVLLNSLFQLISYVIQERLVRIVEGSNILEPGQGGFRARRGCDINMHKLDFITRETQKATSNPFVRIDVDFENAFNSVPHENLWAILRAFEIPDIDLLEAIYSVATVSLAQGQGSGGGVTFDTGVQQGSVLSPTLFNLFLNPLLRLLTAIGQQKSISHGIKGIDTFNNLAFADDLSLIAEVRRLGDPSGGAQTLLNAIEEFSNWSGMEVKVVKSCGMWVGAKCDERLSLKLTFRDQQLKIMSKDTPVRYLGFFQSPDGDWKDMVRRVIEETRKACDKLERHPMTPDEAANLAQAIVIATFRRPAALVPWSTQELSRIEQLWQMAYKEVWHLMRGTCADVLLFPSHAGGMQYPRPMAILWEATARHIERALRHDDVTRQIIIKELQLALDSWMCLTWQDLAEEAALRTWEEARHNIFLRMAKSGDTCKMGVPELPECVFGEAVEGISLMAATRQLRRAALRWKEMSGDWQRDPVQPSWDLSKDQWFTLGGAQQNLKRVARTLWDKGVKDVRGWTRETLPPASRPSLPRHLLFVEESKGNTQATTFVGKEEIRSGTQEIRVWAPQMQKLLERDRQTLQGILDLTDWRGLHMTSTPGTTQRPTEWAGQGRVRGSGFKVVSRVPVRNIPEAPHLETMRRFIANSLMVELKAIQVEVVDPDTRHRDQRRLAVTIQVRGIHRARTMARELKQWMSISLEGVLLECGMWEKGFGSPAPDVPKLVAVLGGKEEERSRPGNWDSDGRCAAYSKQIRAAFEECRSSKDTATERDIWGPDRLGRRDGGTAVKQLTEWLEDGMVESYIGSCIWGPENVHDGLHKGALNVTNLSDEDMTQARWAAGKTLSRSWRQLHQLGAVAETTTACLPNPLPPNFLIEDHLFECLERLKCWLSAVQEIHTNSFTEFLRAHFRSRWTEGRDGTSPPPCIHPPRELSKAKRGAWRRGLRDLMGWITMGRDHAYGGLLSGGFLQEGEGKPEEEAVQMEQRKELMWMAVIDTVETGWTFLQGIGAPEGISLAGPGLVPPNWDFGEYLTEVLETLRAPNSICTDCGGRLTSVCPNCTAGACWFCARHKGCLNCDICGGEAGLSGDWVDGTRLIDDSLSLDSHDMGTFLISGIDGVRIAEHPRSDAPHDRLEFRGTVRGWQPEERQEWIAKLLGEEGERSGRGEDLIEKIWSERNVRPLLLPTRWWPRTLATTTPPQVGEEMLGFNTEAQGWLPCKITDEDQEGALWTVDWWDESREDRLKREEELRPFEEAGWWYRITGRSMAKRCHNCPNSDGTYGQWRTREEWKVGDWNKNHGNLKCIECHEHNRDRERPQSGRPCPRVRGRESLPQTVLICQPADTRLRGEDRDVLGTIKLTGKDLRRILIHGRHFPFLTPEEGETGGVGHWETRVWESCDISVWGTTRELGFPVTRDGDTVKSARDAAEGRRTNFVLSPEILRFCRQALGEGDLGTEPTQCMRLVRELVDQWHHPDEVTELHLPGPDEDTEDQGLSRRLGWCPMKNEWVASWTGGGNSGTGRNGKGGGNGRWESPSTPLQWADPQPLLAAPGTPQVGKNFFLDEVGPVRGFVSVAPVSLAWKDRVGRFEVKLTQGLAVSLQAQYSWTIPSGAWTHRRAHFKGEPEELIKLFHNGRLRQEGLERAGHRSPTWTVLRSLQKVYGATRIRGCTIIDAPPFFESAGNEKVPEADGTDKGLEGSSPTQDEGGATVYWGNDQGPVVMVWDGMLPGEQEKAKKIISDEKDWIIWRTKPAKGEQGDQPGGSGNCQTTTDFLEQFGMRLDGIQQKGPKAQRTSEGRSGGGFTRRRGWYRTNDIRTAACERDMEIWIPKDSGAYSGKDVEAVWDAWRNDTQKDECRVRLEGPEKEWWAGTELGLLRAYQFPGHVTASDGSVGMGSMGAGFVWLDRSRCGSERIGREEEGTSSGRAEIGAYAAILRRTPDHEDLLTATDSEVLCRLVGRWVGQGGKASLANTADADILEFILEKLAARIAAKARTFLVKVKAHRGEPLNEGADDLAEEGRLLAKEGEGYRWKQRTTRLVFSYYDRTSNQWKRGTWSRTIRNAARRGAAESLLEERLQYGANKWRRGLFEEHGEGMEEDHPHPQSAYNWRAIAPDKWEAIASGNWIQKAAWNRMVTTLERDQPHKTPVTSTWTADFLTREGEGRKAMGDWLRDKTISWKARRRLLQTNAGTFPCEGRLQKWGKHPDGTCGLCKRSREMGLKLLGVRPARGTTGHLQSSVCRLQAPAATGAHNTCFQQVQDDMSKARSVSKDWEFVSKGTEISLGRFVLEFFTPFTLDSDTGVISDEDTAEIWGAAMEVAMEKARRNKHKTSGEDSTMIDAREVERSFWLSRPDGWVVNRKMKKIILLEFKRTADYSEAYYWDMKRVAEQQHTPILAGLRALAIDRGWEVEVVPLVAGQRSVKEKEWLESFRVFGIDKEDGKKILHNLGLTLLHEHEKLFCSYWRQTFGPPSSLLQLLGKGVSVRATQLLTEGRR